MLVNPHTCVPPRLAAGLNRPPDNDNSPFRVFGRYCLSGRALDEDAGWTWGHNVKEVAKRAALAAAETRRANGTASARPRDWPEVCARVGKG